MTLTVHKKLAQEITAVFEEMAKMKFQSIRRVLPVITGAIWHPIKINNRTIRMVR